ncbi:MULTISPECIES: dihydrodipicolinate synthase family protein [unclassified Hyphomicrobium]|uniref:dihydrodipicolinate synthase family protein n=1 Tax=unclassified Hyphomicrobium TaxID=2619925 RepID=UPI000213F835|nr:MULTISPECIES: dihydrodipicolinate synthase family protein [unclassified Hyphomicrobium]CCB63401.1 putative dihydrodipicolinate synthetase [Hyphomicrobium sp. MC1]
MQKLDIRRPGILVPPLTPFTADWKVDYAALKNGVDAVVEHSQPALIIAAGVEAQEYQFLPFDERLDLIRATIDAVDDRVPVAVGISHPSFKIAVELAHFAEKHGAKAVQLLAPQKPTGGAAATSELVRYFESVGRETSLPFILYLNAGPGADVSIPATVELAKLEHIKLIKESSRDLARVSRLIAEIEHAGLAHYFTTMQMLLITLQLGGAGVTLPPPASEIAHLLINAYHRGDLSRATELQQVFATYPSRWMSYGLAAVMKASENYLGVRIGRPFPPYDAIDGVHLEELHAFLSSHIASLKGYAHA